MIKLRKDFLTLKLLGKHGAKESSMILIEKAYQLASLSTHVLIALVIDLHQINPTHHLKLVDCFRSWTQMAMGELTKRISRVFCETTQSF